MRVASMWIFIVGEHINNGDGQWTPYESSKIASNSSPDVRSLWQQMRQFEERADYRALRMMCYIQSTSTPVSNEEQMDEFRTSGVYFGSPESQPREIFILADKDGKREMVGPFTSEDDAKFALQLAEG